MIRTRLRLLAWSSVLVMILAVLLTAWIYYLVQKEKGDHERLHELRKGAVALNVLTLDLLYGTTAALRPEQWFRIHESMGRKMVPPETLEREEFAHLLQIHKSLGEHMRNYLDAGAACPGSQAEKGQEVRCRALLDHLASQVRPVLQALSLEIGRLEDRATLRMSRHFYLGNILLLTLLVILSALTLILILPTTRTLERGLNRLMAAANRFSKGDLDERVNVESNDEFGFLSKIFNEMAKRRQRAERELKRKESWLSRLLDTIPHGVQENDRNGVITYSNPAHHRILGRAPGDLVGRHVWDFLVDEKEKAALQQLLDGLLENQPGPTPRIDAHRRADGREVLLESTWDYLRDDNGNITGFISVISDVTERMASETALKKSEAGLAGLSRDEVLGQRLTALFPGSEAIGLPQGLQRAWRTGGPEQLPISHYQDERLALWVENHIFRLPGGEVVAIYQDITARKQAEAALRHRLTVESALAVVSRKLAQASDENSDELIDEALAHIGEAVGVDRSYLFLIDEDHTTFSNIHEWCAEGIRPRKPELQRVPMEVFDAAFRLFEKGEVLKVSSPGDLDDALAPLRSFMEENGIRALLNVPILVEGELLGVVGFDAEHSSKAWPEEDIRLLQTVAENFASLLQRERSLRRLREHAWYLEGLERLSRELSGEREPGEMLEQVARLVLDLFRADRAWFLRESGEEEAGYQVSVEVTRPEYPGALAKGLVFPDDQFGRQMMSGLLAMEGPMVMQIDDIEGLPEYFREFSVRSQMLIALRPEIGHPWIMGIHQCSGIRHWSEVEQRLFCAIAERSSLALATARLLERIGQSERRLKEAEAIAAIGTWELDLGSGKAFWSDQEYRCLGYSPGSREAGYEAFADAVHPDDFERVDAAVQAAIAGELEPYDIQHRVIWPDGRERTVRELAIVERDGDGRPVRMIGTTQDITDRMRLEKELEEYRHHLERLVEARTATIREQAQIIDQTRDAVVTTDLDGFVVGWNRGAEKLFGYGAEEATGRHISLVYAPDQHEFLRSQVIEPLQARGTHDIEVNLLRRDGSDFPAHLSLTMLCDAEGQPKGMVGYTVDISDLKRRERELRELATRLEASNRELESFSYSVSHDLRAPLRAIDGFSLALMEDYHEQLDETARDYLRRIRGGAQRMGALIDDLLQLSRVNRGEIEYREVDLGALAETVMEELRTGEPQREVVLETDPNMVAWGDRRLLGMVIANLLGNAWKFTSREPEGRIQFRRQEGESGVFYIRDNGVGFDMRHAGKLFGAFQRLHRTTDFPGTGVGLATVQRILHRHGGRIWAEAEPGKGATFYFSLGARREPTNAQEGMH